MAVHQVGVVQCCQQQHTTLDLTSFFFKDRGTRTTRFNGTEGGKSSNKSNGSATPRHAHDIAYTLFVVGREGGEERKWRRGERRKRAARMRWISSSSGPSHASAKNSLVSSYFVIRFSRQNRSSLLLPISLCAGALMETGPGKSFVEMALHRK